MQRRKKQVKKRKFISHKYKCVECGDVIQSSYPGEFVECSCGKAYVDETYHYVRLGGKVVLTEDK